MREGKESTLHPGMGVYALCMGPNSPMPGERLQIVIYNQADEVVRRFEQIRGACLVEGYATFFANDPRAQQAVFLWPLVDIDAAGVVTELHPDYGKTQGPEPYRTILAAWVAEWGIPDGPPRTD
jgi:hypothetical protein